jgi:hypothetical protein
MTLSRALAAFVLAAALAAPAMAAAPTAPLRLPAFRPGPVMTFAAENRVTQSDSPNVPLGTGRKWTFDLQVLAAAPDGTAIVRYTLRSSVTAGPDSRGDPWFALMKDTPIDLNVDPSGVPQKVSNYAAIKARFLPILPATVSAADADTVLQNNLVDTVLVRIAGMQVRPEIPVGHTVLPADEQAAPDHQVTRSIDFVGLDAKTCEAEIQRTTTLTVTRQQGAPITETLRSSALISTSDGWLSSLDETVTVGGLVETDTIRRTTPVGCR